VIAKHYNALTIPHRIYGIKNRAANPATGAYCPKTATDITRCSAKSKIMNA